MNNVKENLWREIEETKLESVMVKKFKALSSCSDHFFVYLESGIVPARYQLMLSNKKNTTYEENPI